MVTTPVMRMIMTTMTLMSFDINIGGLSQSMMMTATTTTNSYDDDCNDNDKELTFLLVVVDTIF